MDTTPIHFDVAIIGGGPAGLMAAARAAARGRTTILIDKNREPGVKILLSGGSRCNLTHATDARGVVEAFGPNGRFLHSALAALGPKKVVEFFDAEGVPTKVEPDGKVFPASDRASDVRAALVRIARRAGCTFALGETVVTVEAAWGEGPGTCDAGTQTQTAAHTPAADPPCNASAEKDTNTPTDQGRAEKGGGEGDWINLPVRPEGCFAQIVPVPLSAPPRFRLLTTQRTILAHSVILATGGQSYPACGTTGDGYRWAAALGHRIIAPHTALVPITSHAPWALALQGITLPDVSVAVVDADANVMASRRGALLFTHFGVSGPAAMDVSRVVSASADPSRLLLRCDLLPNIRENALDELLATEAASAGKRRVAGLLDRWLPHRVAETVTVLADVSPNLPAAELSKSARRRLARTAKQLDIPISGTMGFRKAEVTAGGVALDEVDSRTMQSRLVPGLFFAGELLDLDGPIGGYNFQAAFSTGWLAGQSV